MAAKRFAGVKVNWKSIMDRFGMQDEEQMTKLMKLKKNHEVYVRRVAALPEKPPAIDWAFYKNKIPNAAFVDSIKQKYEAIQVPYPKDNVSSDVDAREKELAQWYGNFKEESNRKIKELEAQLEQVDNLLSIEHMTLQEFNQAYPEKGINLNYPTPCPDDEEAAAEWRKYIAAKAKGIPAEKPRG